MSYDFGTNIFDPCGTPDPRDLKAETLGVNNAEEYGRLTSSDEYLQRHRRAEALGGAVEGIVEGLGGR